MPQVVLAPRLDVRGAEVRAVLRTVNDLLHREANLSSDVLRMLILNCSIDRVGFQTTCLNELADRMYAGTVHDRLWQRGLKDAIEVEWVRTVHDDPSSVLLQNLHSYFFPDSATDEVIETSGAYRFVKDLTKPGRSALIEGVNDSGKSDRAFWHIEQLHNLKLEQMERPRESVLHRVRQLRRWRAGPAGEKAEAEWEDERSVGIENVPEDRVSHQRKDNLDLYSAKDFKAVVNVSVSARSEHIGAIVQAFDMKRALTSILDNEESETFTTLFIDEGGNAANKQRQMKMDNVALHEFYRTKRKFFLSLQIATQDERAQIDDEIRRGTQTRVHKKSRYVARYTVSGVFHEREFSNCQPTVIGFDTQDFSPFKMNVVPSLLFETIAAERASHERDPLAPPWTHRDNMRAMREAIRDESATDAEYERGESQWTSNRILHAINRHPTWTDRRIAIEVTDEEGGVNITEERVAGQRKVWEERKRDERKARPGKPKYQTDPDAFRDYLLRATKAGT